MEIVHPLLLAGVSTAFTWGLLRMRANAILGRVQAAPSRAVTPDWELEVRRLHRTIVRSKPWDLQRVWPAAMRLEQIVDSASLQGGDEQREREQQGDRAAHGPDER